ncbi:hypothetical protein IQ06DRAFT_333804 [Phaeosphaeriaceae sp. SRC1lsM3a]|nr:hypothetical protein IQ06DRAFT_333804 [Stagonospora sp. SRC1lsM3a]
MSTSSLHSPPCTPHPPTDFDIASYLEAQRAGFSSSPAPELSRALRHDRNDSATWRLEDTSLHRHGEKKGKEKCSQQATVSSSTPLLSILAGAGRRTPNRTFRAPRMSWSWGMYRAMSPFSAGGEEDEDDQDGESSREEDEGKSKSRDQRSPSPNPISSPDIEAVATARHMHLRTVCPREINLQDFPALTRCPPREAEEGSRSNEGGRQGESTTGSPSPPLSRRIAQTPLHLQRANPHAGFCGILGYRSTLYPRLPPHYPSLAPISSSPAPPSSSSARSSVAVRRRTPSGSRFVEHVRADGAAMYACRGELLGSRSSVALGGSHGNRTLWDVVGEEEDEKGDGEKRGSEGKKRRSRARRGCRRLCCFA